MLHLAWLNSFHQSGMKNLMDQAVIRFGRGKPGIEALGRFSKVDELPFDFLGPPRGERGGGRKWQAAADL